MKKFGKSSAQQGRSMIEMLGVLSIVGVLSVAGITGYSKAMAKYKTAKAIDQVYQIVSGLQRMFGSQYGYKELASDPTANAIAFGAIPEEMTKGGDPINAFGGGVSLSVAKVDTRENGGFVLTFSDLPREAAIALSRVDWDSGSNTLLNISLNPESPITELSTTNTVTEIAISDLSCIDSTGNSISWGFR